MEAKTPTGDETRRPLDEVFSARFVALVRDAFSQVIDTRHAHLDVVDAILTSSLSPTTESDVEILTAVVRTDNRDLIAGLSTEFDDNSRDGHNTYYVQGYVEAILRASGEISPLTKVSVDVVQDDTLGCRSGSQLYRHRTYDDLIASGFLTPTSQLAKICRLYELKRFLTSGKILCGPSLGLVTELQSAIGRSQSATVVDLFSGPACLSRVALQHGAAKSIAVDNMLDHGAVSENLGVYGPSCVAIQCDAGALSLANSVDIVVCDPFYETALAQMSAVRHILDQNCETVIVNLGALSHPAWCAEVRELVGRAVPFRYEQAYGLELIGVFSRADFSV